MLVEQGNPAPAPQETDMTAPALRTAAEILENIVGVDAPEEYAPSIATAVAALAPTAETFGEASKVLQADREGFCSLYLDDRVALALLVGRGWTIEPQIGGGNAYVKPGCKLRGRGGKFGVDYLWERDDALTLALTAEAVALGLDA